MSEAQLKNFLEAIKADPILKEKLKACSDINEIMQIAQQIDFDLSLDELLTVQLHLSDDELENVTGGRARAAGGEPCSRQTPPSTTRFSGIPPVCNN